MQLIPVSLDDDVHAELERIATETGRPATLLAQDAVVAWLESRRRVGLRVVPEPEVEPELEAASVEIEVPPDDGAGLPPKIRRRTRR